MANKLTLIKLSVMYDLETEIDKKIDGGEEEVAVAAAAASGGKGYYYYYFGRKRCSFYDFVQLNYSSLLHVCVWGLSHQCRILCRFQRFGN